MKTIDWLQSFLWSVNVPLAALLGVVYSTVRYNEFVANAMMAVSIVLGIGAFAGVTKKYGKKGAHPPLTSGKKWGMKCATLVYGGCFLLYAGTTHYVLAACWIIVAGYEAIQLDNYRGER